MIEMIQNDLTIKLVTEAEKARPFGIDMSIESMSSQQFSVGIFYFLVVAIIIFVGITFMFMFKGTKGKTLSLKKGEIIMFVWILFGVVVAIIFGAAQMMYGYLF